MTLTLAWHPGNSTTFTYHDHLLSIYGAPGMWGYTTCHISPHTNPAWLELVSSEARGASIQPSGHTVASSLRPKCAGLNPNPTLLLPRSLSVPGPQWQVPTFIVMESDAPKEQHHYQNWFGDGGVTTCFLSPKNRMAKTWVFRQEQESF